MADEYREEKENTKGKEEEEGKTGKGTFRFRHIFLFGLLLLFLLALFSHDKADLSVLEGGTSEPIRNWIGPLGAQIARAMLYLLGLASYPVSILLTISILRPFLPYPLKRPSGYTGALITVCLGITILMAMWPQEFCRSTDALGIGRAETPALALSGGVIGSQLAAPETEYINAGLIRNYIGTIGTAVVAMILILPGLFFLFMADWKDLLTELLRRQLENSRNFPQHAMEEGRNGKTESLRRRSAPGPLSGSNEEVAEPESVQLEHTAHPHPPIRRPGLDGEETSSGDGGTGDSPPWEESGTTTAAARQASSSPHHSPGVSSGNGSIQSSPATGNKEDDEDEYYKPAPPAPLPGQLVGIPQGRGAGSAAAFMGGIQPLSSPSSVSASPHQPQMMRPASAAAAAAAGGNEFPYGHTAQEKEEEEGRKESSFSAAAPGNGMPGQARVKTYDPEKANHAEPLTSGGLSAAGQYPPQAQGGGKIKRGGSSLQNFGDCQDYTLPPVSLLDKQKESKNEDVDHIELSRERLQSTLESFNVDGRVSEIVVGPRVTRFEISLENGVKVEKVTSIQNNIAMDLAAESIRILAPIPGKNTVGIEVPNKVSSVVYIRSLMESATWRDTHMSIPIILGRDIGGAVVATDLAKAPHLLIAGSTGSGKSVCMNTLIMSLLFKFPPSRLRLILVDPKVVELEMYRPLPHLITPVVNDPKKVPLALRWGVNEMERRYKVLAKVKAKNLAGFNGRPPDPEPVLDDDGNVIPPELPLLVIIIDELADIMMTEAKADVETSICRIAQKGRAAGIHLVIATQTPRKDVITGLIKANLPTKIAFKVGSNMDSRVILDAGGAEKLLGMGDMLFKPPGASGLERIQGSMVSDPEIQRVVDFVSGQVEQHFDTQVVAEDVEVKNAGENPSDEDEEDLENVLPSEFANSVAAKYLQPGDGDLIRRALEIVINENKVSTSYLQRRLGVGYNKSAEIIDVLEERGIISGPLPGGQKREILVFDELEKND